MIRPASILKIAVIWLMTAFQARAEDCNPWPTEFHITVQENDVVIESGVTLSELYAMSSRLRQLPPHPVLGSGLNQHQNAMMAARATLDA